MSILDKYLVISMPDSSKWAVPVRVIAEHRAKQFADEFDGDVERSLSEDTEPYFADDDYNIEDWAANNMNWVEVESRARRIPELSGSVDYQEGWVNGDKEVRSLII
ncbi:TPA: hypothetical protein ACPWOC_000061 [Pseudomonas aeruginosa]